MQCTSQSAPPPPSGRYGWPWDALYAAMLARGEAERRLLAAQVDSNPTAVAAAELEAAQALGEWLRLREELARVVVTGLRWAIEHDPAGLAAVLAEAEPIRQMAADLDEVAEAVVRLQAGGRVAAR